MATITQPTNRIQTTATSRRYLDRPARPRGLWGQLNMLVFQPGAFFTTLPALHQGRHWLWIALLLLALVSFNAVQQSSSAAAPAGAEFPVITGDEFGRPGDMGLPPDMGFIPEGIPSPTAGSAANVSSNWAKALVASATLLLQWLVLGALLCEVSLFNGVKPQYGKNLQIAIWAGVPLAFMTIVQLIYQSAGGTVGQPGLTGLLAETEAYHQFSSFGQSIMWSLAAHLTLFWLWSLLLIYIGARYALHGKRWAALLTLAAWVIVLTVVPVLTGAVTAPQPMPEENLPPYMELESGIEPGGDMEGMESEFIRPEQGEQPPARVPQIGG